MKCEVHRAEELPERDVQPELGTVQRDGHDSVSEKENLLDPVAMVVDGAELVELVVHLVEDELLGEHEGLPALHLPLLDDVEHEPEKGVVDLAALLEAEANVEGLDAVLPGQDGEGGMQEGLERVEEARRRRYRRG